ncbi:MAG: ROK family transcriptional regulator [Pyrinomonadaceae bacterium]|nr:ROK family transcriptional regulator [Pyrinomonadaceae bacterium]
MRRINLDNAQAARSSTIRDINRQIVLNYVREREPISRAEIARETALQRSTVSTIIEGLKSDGLVEEIGAGESTGGRRPTLLRLRAAGALAVGVDITPTHTTVATSDLAGRVLRRESFLTDPASKKTTEQVVALVRKLTGRGGKVLIEGIGVSVPGLVDPQTGVAIDIPYFKWRDWPVANEISARTNLEVVVDNDANSAALAELWFGRPEVREARDFILVFIGEGVGTGIVFDGQIYRGARGAAGEFGHMIVGQEAPTECSCGNRDCWEAFASGRAAVARYLQKNKQRKKAQPVNFEILIERALEGEPAAVEALSETARYIGIGISNLIVGLSPKTVVVGGAITSAWSLVAGAMEEATGRSVRRGLPSVSVLPSTLGEQPTLMGAVSLILARKFASAAAA